MLSDLRSVPFFPTTTDRNDSLIEAFQTAIRLSTGRNLSGLSLSCQLLQDYFRKVSEHLLGKKPEYRRLNHYILPTEPFYESREDGNLSHAASLAQPVELKFCSNIELESNNRALGHDLELSRSAIPSAAVALHDLTDCEKLNG